MLFLDAPKLILIPNETINMLLLRESSNVASRARRIDKYGTPPTRQVTSFRDKLTPADPQMSEYSETEWFHKGHAGSHSAWGHSRGFGNT